MDDQVPGGVLAAVCDSEARRLAAFGGVAQFGDWSDLIRSGKVDAVVVAKPHRSHVAIGWEVLAAGLHWLMEKPLAVQTSHGKILLERPRRWVRWSTVMR